MQETQKPQVPSLGHKIPMRRKWQLTPVFFSWESYGQRSLGYSPWGNKRVGCGWAYLSKRAEAQSKDRPSNESEQERDSLPVHSALWTSQASQSGFSCLFFPHCFYLSREEKKKRKWQRSIWLIQEKLGREISLPWSCFSANPLSWTPRSISPLLLSGDENFSASMESPSQLQSHSCFPTKADK